MSSPIIATSAYAPPEKKKPFALILGVLAVATIIVVRSPRPQAASAPPAPRRPPDEGHRRGEGSAACDGRGHARLRPVRSPSRSGGRAHDGARRGGLLLRARSS
ncbi:MAG: hypothetical protein U0270_35140 [Labilithrix sp.]